MLTLEIIVMAKMAKRQPDADDLAIADEWLTCSVRGHDRAELCPHVIVTDGFPAVLVSSGASIVTDDSWWMLFAPVPQRLYLVDDDEAPYVAYQDQEGHWIQECTHCQYCYHRECVCKDDLDV